MSHNKTVSKSANVVTEENLCVRGSSPFSGTNFQAYYTPGWLAKDMVGLANIKPAQIVLEPSAGHGDLAMQIFKSGVDISLITCVELNQQACDHLRALGFNPIHRDFLSMKPQPIFDAVLMNPPSRDDRYIDHVLHALDFLKPSGRLVALIVNRFLSGTSEKENDLRIAMADTGRLYQIAYPVFAVDDQKIDASILVIDKQ